MITYISHSKKGSKPKMELTVHRVESNVWDLFKEHHYLTGKCSKGFGYLLFSWKDNPIAICVYKPQPTGQVPNAYALARTVVLPDYQGMGLGSKISEFVSGILINNGKRVYTKTINPALGEHRSNSKNFKPTSQNGKVRKITANTDKMVKTRLTRASYCHEYIGKAIEGFENLILPVAEARKFKLSL